MNLTAEQHAAVNTESSDCLVVAGAGTGKTAVLTGRIRRLLHGGASPEQLLVMTFTRKAAAEMRARVLARLIDDGAPHPARMAGGILLGTFHHFALHVLQSHGNALGYRQREITVVDVADADMLLVSCCRDLGIVHDGKWKGGHTWTRVRAVRDDYYQTGRWRDDGDRAVRSVQHYHSSLFAMNAVDYGLLLTRCFELLSVPAVFDYWTGRIKHVLVDEVQDCDRVQHNIVDVFLAASDTTTVFAVGDPRQSIYGWRGACPDFMSDDNPTQYALTHCFRSGDTIVDAANALIAHNTDAGAPMQPSDTNDVVIHAAGRSADIADVLKVLHDPSEHEMDEWFAMTDGFAWSEMAVLSRNHFALKALANVLDVEGVPYHRVGSGFDVCDSERFRTLHAVLRLAVNECDDLAAMQVMAMLGVFRDLSRYRLEASEQGTSLGAYLIRGARGQFGMVSELFTKLRTDAVEVTIADATEWVAESGLFGDAGLYAEARLFWTYHCLEMDTFADALDWFATRDAQDDLTEDDVVTLSTIHAAKGREWSAVVVLDLNEGSLPGHRSLWTPEAIDEERRVCYVALTRAKQCVVLHHRRHQDQVRERRKQAPSRFLSDMGHPVLEDLNVGI